MRLITKEIPEQNMAELGHLTSRQTYPQSADKKNPKSDRFKKINEDEDFELEYHMMKKLKLTLNRSRFRKGIWTVQENKIYLKFLLDHRPDFAT